MKNNLLFIHLTTPYTHLSRHNWTLRSFLLSLFSSSNLNHHHESSRRRCVVLRRQWESVGNLPLRRNYCNSLNYPLSKSICVSHVTRETNFTIKHVERNSLSVHSCSKAKLFCWHTREWVWARDSKLVTVLVQLQSGAFFTNINSTLIYPESRFRCVRCTTFERRC